MFIDPDGRRSMIYSAGGIMRWDFDPMTTINGISWFEDSINYISSGRSRFQADAGGGDGSGDALSPGGAFVDSQLFKDVMAYLEEPGFDFSQFDFSKFGNDLGPGPGPASAIAGILTRGTGLIGAATAGGIGALWYSVNTAFGSAHVPQWAGTRYSYSNIGSKTFNFEQVKTEARSTPVRERMGQVGSYTIFLIRVTSIMEKVLLTECLHQHYYR